MGIGHIQASADKKNVIFSIVAMSTYIQSLPAFEAEKSLSKQE